MGFKIGDQVRCDHYDITGRVVDFDSRGRRDSQGEVLYDIEWEGRPMAGRSGWSRSDDRLTRCAPITPRGPKPLTLNGGRPRFTVTAGLTVRKPPRHWTNDMWLLRAPGRER